MIKTRAIVLSRYDISEYDAIVLFYSLDFGKISILAKGLKRPKSKLAGHLEPLNLVELMIIEGREKNYVGSAISDNSFLGIKNSYNKLVLAGSAIKFLKDLSFEQEADFNIFLLLRDFLINLNNYDQDDAYLDFLLLYFKVRILDILGYNFDFSRCSACGQVSAIFFDFFNKEVLCLNCSNSNKYLSSNLVKISQSTINLKKNILSVEFSEFKSLTFDNPQLKELDNFINIIKKII